MSTKKISAKPAKGDKGSRARGSRKPKVAAALGDFDLHDYKAADILKRFLSETGKILPRRRSGLNAQDQRKLARTIKRARMLGLIPFTDKLVRK